MSSSPAPTPAAVAAIRGLSTPIRHLLFVLLAWLLAACGSSSDSSGSGVVVPAGDPVTGLPMSAITLVAIDNGQLLYYATPAAATVEIRLDKPAGPLVARIGGGRGHVATGDWIRDGMRFHLQDVSNDRPLTAEHTLATAIATVDADAPGRPGAVLGATPGLVPDPANSGLGATTLYWNAPGATGVEVRVGAPDGPLLAQSGPTGTLSTGAIVTDGLRFYLQDRSAGASTSTANTLAVATVDLQPSLQRYLAYFHAGDGVVIHSRDSMHRLGSIPPDAFPPGVTASDLKPTPDGALLVLLGSDFNYYLLDPATDSVSASFAAGAGARSFGVMKGSLGQDLLVAAADDQGKVAIVDPAQRSVVAVLDTPCFGTVSGLMTNPSTGAASFVCARRTGLPALPPEPGGSGLTLHAVTADLRLEEPYPLPLPSTWSAGMTSAGASMLMLAAGTRGTLLVTWTEFRSVLFPSLPSDIVAFDLAVGAASTLTAAFTRDARLAVPRLAAPDGSAVHAQPMVLAGVGPGQRGTVLPGELSLFAATPGAAAPFAWAATLPNDDQSPRVIHPLALDDRHVFYGQVGIVGGGGSPWSSQPDTPFFLARADRATLLPIGGTTIVVDDDPASAIVAPLVGLSLGAYNATAVPSAAR
jgi:hypothetical protein